MTYQTKWSVLTARLEEAQSVVDQLKKQLDGMDATPCNLTCSGCGELLATEGDFARHFSIADTRYLNLGNCPKKDRPNEVYNEDTIEVGRRLRNSWSESSVPSACPNVETCSADNPCSDACHQRYIVLSQYKSTKEN